jgi:hypothetical protein
MSRELGVMPVVSLEDGDAESEQVRNCLDIPSLLHKVHALN